MSPAPAWRSKLAAVSVTGFAWNRGDLHLPQLPWPKRARGTRFAAAQAGQVTISGSGRLAMAASGAIKAFAPHPVPGPARAPAFAKRNAGQILPGYRARLAGSAVIHR